MPGSSPANVRRILRKVSEVGPRCATSTKELALHVLKGQCRFHEEKRGTKTAQQVDGFTESKYDIVGVAYKKDAIPKDKAHRYMDCGCDLNTALLDFLWFKTWTVKSANPTFKQSETVKGDILEPRHRAFFAQAYCVGTLLNIDDLYSVNPPYGTPEYTAKMRKLQVDRIIDRYTQVLLAAGFDCRTLGSSGSEIQPLMAPLVRRRDFAAGGTTSSGGRIQPPTLDFWVAAGFGCRYIGVEIFTPKSFRQRDLTAGGTTSGGRIEPPTLNFWVAVGFDCRRHNLFWQQDSAADTQLWLAAGFDCRRHNLFWRQDSAADTRFLGRGGIWLQNMGVVSSCLHRALCFPQHKSLPSPPPASAHPNPMSAPQTPLPILPTYPVPPYVYIETLLEANQHLQAILAGAVIGFDLEWVTLPNRPKLSRAGKKAKLRAEIRDASTFVVDWSQVEVCLAQIATHNSVYIINLRVIQDLPAELIRICEDPGILKVSVGIYSDGQQMWDSFRVNILSAVSLGLAGKLAYPNDILPDKPYANEPALGTIVRHVLQYDLSKELQTSPWDSVPLSDAQKEYAASDAHATFESYRVIDTAIASCGFPVAPAYQHFKWFPRPNSFLKHGTYNYYDWESVDLNPAYSPLKHGLGSMVDTQDSVRAQACAKYAVEAHRRAAAAYRWRQLPLSFHRQRIKAEELDLGDRKERARASDEKYRQKQREVLAWKQRMRRQNGSAYIAKYGMSAYVERCERERSAREAKDAAIDKDIAERQAQTRERREARDRAREATETGAARNRVLAIGELTNSGNVM
ncbi:hypothetical protein B0H12DRAFT_1066399 [Mycena haematopus]|nr:hypothetical protein B0H12DRAFT_1066399 [Mycena haematopus]